jgi:Rps23 Pro-64 3,4-dihydroxylase Tpa1-like proline 4-hydroxylase
LNADFACAIADELTKEQDWNLVFRDNGRHYDLHRTQWEALVGETYRLLRERVIAVGRLEFQYWYYNLPLYDMVATGRTLSPALGQLYQLLQSEDFIGRMRELTAVPAVDFADCQATRYTEGSFLTTHDDEVAGKHRHAAYVLGLSRDWCPDWGGLLSFPQHRGKPAQYLLPDFNSLYLFRVPQPHFVSMVSPLAERPRYSITGWLRSRSHNEAGE